MLEEYGIIAWIVIGGIAGAIAKMLMPGGTPAGASSPSFWAWSAHLSPGGWGSSWAGTNRARAPVSWPRSSAPS